MKQPQRKGEVFTMTVLVIAAIAGFFFGSTSNPIKSIFGIGDRGQKTKQSYVLKTESKPIIVKGDDGKQYILQATKTERSTLNTSEEPKMTLWQKLMVLPKLWLLLMVLGIFFPPLAGIMHVINTKLKSEVKTIVGGMEESLKKIDDKPEVKKEILDTLSKKYDSSTKLLVAKIKSKL